MRALQQGLRGLKREQGGGLWRRWIDGGGESVRGRSVRGESDGGMRRVGPS